MSANGKGIIIYDCELWNELLEILKHLDNVKYTDTHIEIKLNNNEKYEYLILELDFDAKEKYL